MATMYSTTRPLMLATNLLQVVTKEKRKPLEPKAKAQHMHTRTHAHALKTRAVHIHLARIELATFSVLG